MAKAERAKLSGAVRATAVIQADETREAHVHTKLSGWVQDLYANEVGQEIKKGQPLYSLYAQELYAAQKEYLSARQNFPDLASAARKRLELWDVPEDQIKLIERDGTQKAILFRSPVAGTIIEKSVLKGHYVEPGAMLYRIADLSQVWFIASVYEFEVNRLDKKGMAKLEVQGVPEPVMARVDYVYPTVEAATRTVKVRLVVPNPSGFLRPGAYATAELPTLSTDALWVPEEAVVDTGVRQVVYLVKPEGHFLPVNVRVGRRAEGRAEILEGLDAGAEVVVSAQFLIDSESRIRGTGQPGGHAGHGGH